MSKATPKEILDSFAEITHAAVPFWRRWDDAKDAYMGETFQRADWVFETKIGTLIVHYIDGRDGGGEAFVATSFEIGDAKRIGFGYSDHPAVKHLGISNTSLKWNFHTFSYASEKQRRNKAGRLKAEYDMVNSFIAELSPLLLPIHDEQPEPVNA